MTEQEQTRYLFGMFAFNGLLSRLNPDEIDVDGVWEFVNVVMESADTKPVGIMAIKPKKRKE